jgi:hypothetical protein
VQLNERLECNNPPYSDNVLKDIAACIRRGDDYDHINGADVSKKVLDLMDVGLLSRIDDDDGGGWLGLNKLLWYGTKQDRERMRSFFPQAKNLPGSFQYLIA